MSDGTRGGELSDLEHLDAKALEALGARDFAAARRWLTRAVEVDPEDVARWLKLAAACRAAGDLPAALTAVDRGLAHSPRDFLALLMRANLLERMGQPHAEAYAIAAGLAPPETALDPATAAALSRGRKIYEDHVERKRAALQAAGRAANTGADSFEIDRFIDDHLRLTRRYRQEPSDYYFPGLPDIEFYPRRHFPWIEAFEAETPAILEELRGVMDPWLTGFKPYIDYADHLPIDQFAPLNHNPDWGAFHLIQNGQRIDANANRCPRTMAAISRLPQPVVPNRAPAAMFSALKPRTRIPPHTGVTNTRLVVHLPLIIPPNCVFRVGNVTREWTVGEAFSFDDTLEHEAWNDSDQLRVILIVDVWNPYLTAEQRAAIVSVMGAIDAFDQSGVELGL